MKTSHASFYVAVSVCLISGCGSAVNRGAENVGPASSRIQSGGSNPSLVKAVDRPLRTFKSVGSITFGEPLAVAIDFEGNVVIADGLPGRVIQIRENGEEAVEYQKPSQSRNFYPSDVTFSGFFLYALDEVGRKLLRFDKTGAYRDLLINFDETLVAGRRISPAGLDVDGSGRVAVCDATNHLIILFDSYLGVELVFGSYGSGAGQFYSPEGITFTKSGGLLVTDSGNRRVQELDAGGKYVRSIPSPSEPNPLQQPRRTAVGPQGNIFVADPVAGAVFVFDPAGNLERTIVPLGAERFRPTDVDVTASGLIYVTDAATSSVHVFR